MGAIEAVMVLSHPGVAAGLAEMIHAPGSLEIVATLDPRQLDRIDAGLPVHRPHVVVAEHCDTVDVERIARLCAAHVPPARLMVIGRPTDDCLVECAVVAGAAGLVEWGIPVRSLAAAIESVGRGGTVLSAAVARSVVRPHAPARMLTRDSFDAQLLGVLDGAAEGLTDSTIAARMGVSQAEVDIGFERLCERFAVGCRLGILTAAAREELLTLGTGAHATV